MTLTDRIETNPRVMLGKHGYPRLTHEDIRAAMRWRT